jgi:hypothetical protein
VPGVPQPIQELLCRRPLGGGILELSAEAHTPAYAIRRKIATSHISNSGGSQTPELNIFFTRPEQDEYGKSDQRLELVVGHHHGQELTIAFVGEQLTGLLHIDPPQLVDFLIGCERACRR